MGDLISRQAAIDIAYPFDDNERNLIDALEELPTADVVEVVRCKDCIYKEECGREVLVNEYDNDKAVDITGFLFYCSYGERKGE